MVNLGRGGGRKRSERDAVGRSGRRLGLSGLTWYAIGTVLVTRLALLLVAMMVVRALPRVAPYPEQLYDRFLAGYPLLDGWARWDVSHYVAVARLGYGDPESPSHDGGVGFFPLYPMLMRAAVQLVGAEPTGPNLALAALAISFFCFLVAVPLFAGLVADQLGERIARTATLLLCVSPFAFFFTAAYSESLFLLLAIASLRLSLAGRWRLAAAVAGLATVSRLVALALAPALVYLAWRRGEPLRELIITAAISVWGVVAYFGYLWATTGNPLAYFAAQSNWGDWRDYVWYYAEFLARDPVGYVSGDPRRLVILLNLLLGLGALALLPLVWRWLDGATAMLTTLLVVVQFANTWVSLGRYLLPAVGCAIVLAALLEGARPRDRPDVLLASARLPRTSTPLRDLTLVASAVLMAALMGLFAAGFWVV
ncbi:MAG TPA: mannosyltransferase family protein [Thermomicrobiales bacterium]|nr:mannosyltransferase family protein [Thermomicrobiales bacterium]